MLTFDKTMYIHFYVFSLFCSKLNSIILNDDWKKSKKSKQIWDLKTNQDNSSILRIYLQSKFQINLNLLIHFFLIYSLYRYGQLKVESNQPIFNLDIWAHFG